MYDFDIQQLRKECRGGVAIVDMSIVWSYRFKDWPFEEDIMSWGNKGFKLGFTNGYGASVQRHIHTYGYEDGLWEVAVLDQEGNLCYDTPVTDDVLGYLSWDEVVAACREISELE